MASQPIVSESTTLQPLIVWALSPISIQTDTMSTPRTAKTPARTPSAQKKTAGSASGGKQQSILGFFNKPASAKATPTPKALAPKEEDASPTCLKESTKTNFLARPSRAKVTPVPSSDAIEPPSSQENINSTNVKVASPVLPSPVTPADRS